MDRTAAELTNGDAVLVELDDTAETLRFLDDDDRIVAEYPIATFGTVTAALALDLGLCLVLSPEAVAQVQQWARI